MSSTDHAQLRIYLGESDRHHGRPLYEVLVEQARRQGLAGATVLRGPLGFGRSARLHTAKVLRLADDLPLVIEVIDERDRIEAFLAASERFLGDLLVTRQPIEVLEFGADG